MALQSLDITYFRNIHQASLNFAPGLNLMSGDNAAGKTSLLEAIYYLGRVRSFRTHLVNQPIQSGQSGFRLVGQLLSAAGQTIPIGIERQTAQLRVHLAGNAVSRLSDLAGSFPVQVLSSDTATILNGGPRYRRQVLDWAMFHVEPAYRHTWQRYARALRQRNAALRARMPDKQISTWDGELLDAGLHIHHYRQVYFERLTPVLQREVSRLLPAVDVNLSYQRGWAADRELAVQLQRGLERDRQTGTTHSGPHRADFKLTVAGQPLPARCSRGQQKAAVVAFMLAQVIDQREQGAPLGAFLLDDLGSELDRVHQARVLDCLRELGVQVFVTAIDESPLDLAAWSSVRRFHVERGEVREVV